jgi:hypothetical protein
VIEKIKKIYLIAGIYGIVNLLPQYFMENKIGLDYPPAITHPEMFYGFIGVALAWQFFFIIISKDPVRYKPVMIPAIFEKASFGFAAVFLFISGRIPSLVLFFGLIDLLLMTLFIFSYMNTPELSVKEEVK